MLGIASFITSLFFHIVGVILGIIVIKKSRSDIRKDAADKNACVGQTLGITSIVVAIFLIVKTILAYMNKATSATHIGMKVLEVGVPFVMGRIGGGQ